MPTEAELDKAMERHKGYTRQAKKDWAEHTAKVDKEQKEGRKRRLQEGVAEDAARRKRQKDYKQRKAAEDKDLATAKRLHETGDWVEHRKRYPQWHSANPGTTAREKRAKTHSNKRKK